jgi:hypothetical protein
MPTAILERALCWANEMPPCEVVVDVTKRNAYAYLRLGGTIVSDVWLFNCVDAPEEPEWTDRKLAPFLRSHKILHHGEI